MEELPSILWSYHTTSREETSMPPLYLVYDGEIVVPTEIGMPSTQGSAYVEDTIEKHLVELDLVEKSQDRSLAWLRACKQ